MKKMTDEELQQWLENQQPLSPNELTDHETRTYSALFEALSEEPEEGLPYDFAAGVTRKVQAETARGKEWKRYVVNAFWFLLATSALIVLLAFRSQDYVHIFMQYKWVIGLSLIAFCVVQGLDEQLTWSRLFKK